LKTIGSPGITPQASELNPQAIELKPHPAGADGQLSIADGHTRLLNPQLIIGTLRQAIVTLTCGHVIIGTDRTGQVLVGMDLTGQVAMGTDTQGVRTLRAGQVMTELTGDGTQLTAAFESILPAPNAVFGTGPVCASLRALDSRHALICACVRLPFFWNIRAIVPVTCGAAIDVPPMRK
jgi:hypothetical protein